MLFDKDFRYTTAANKLDKDIENATREIILKAIKDGASPRDVEYIASEACRMTCLAWLIGCRD